MPALNLNRAETNLVKLRKEENDLISNISRLNTTLAPNLRPRPLELEPKDKSQSSEIKLKPSEASLSLKLKKLQGYQSMDLDTILYKLSLNPEDHHFRLCLIKHYIASDEHDIALNHI